MQLLHQIVGIFFVRRQGMNLLFNAQKNLSQGIMPTEEIKGGIFLLISGLFELMDPIVHNLDEKSGKVKEHTFFEMYFYFRP